MTSAELIDELSSYVPTLIVRRLRGDVAATLTPSVERFPAAVLFADISGFTALTAYLSSRTAEGSEELTQLLNNYFAQLVDIVMAHGGDVVKFAGDGLLALWYGDDDLATHTFRAVQCGLAVQMLMAPGAWSVFGADHEPPVPLKVRVGIGAGEVTLMHLGGLRGRWELLVTGPPLEQAGRAEAAASSGDVLIADEAWYLLAGRCVGEPLPVGAVRLDALLDLLPLHPLEMPALPPNVHSLLRAYVPQAITTRLAGGQTEWIAEQRRVTVLFINLPDLRAELPIERAQQLMQALQSSLYRYEGSISRLGTDAKGPTMMAAFGLPPLAHEDDATRGAAAALLISERLAEIGFATAIGVTTGLAFCGSVGSATRRREYSMIGPTVNLAARLMQAATRLAQDEGPQVFCDATTRQTANGNLRFRDHAPLQLKGLDTLVDVFQPFNEIVNAPTIAVDVPRKDVELPLIGREREMSSLLQLLTVLVERGQGAVALVEGEAGIGKSRLLAESAVRAEQLGLRVLSGAGSPVERATPYFAWNAIAAQLRGTAQRAPEGRQPLLQALQDAAAEGPVLLVFDDAHWLDSASWSLILAASQLIRSVLFLIALRPLAETPTEFQALRYAPGTRFLRLDGLAADAVADLLRLHLGVREIPPALVASIVQQALGNPLFSSELLLSMRDAGRFAVVGGSVYLVSEEAPREGQFASGGRLQLPDTLRGLITSRIDQLSAEQQLMLKVASVIGMTFPLRVLSAIYPVDMPTEQLAAQLFVTQQRELTVIEQLEPELIYSFKQALVRDAAYTLMSYAQRRQLHRALALVYEREAALTGESPSFALLAHHWRAAGDLAATLRYLEGAGDQALYSGAFQEAVAFFREALKTLGQETDLASVAAKGAQASSKASEVHSLPNAEALRQARWERQIGEALYGMGQLSESRIHLERALQLLGMAVVHHRAALLGDLGVQLLRQLGHRLLPVVAGETEGQRVMLAEAARAYELLGRLAYYDSHIVAAFYAALRGLNSAERANSLAATVRAFASMQVATAPLPLVPQLYGYLARRAARRLDSPSACAWVAQAHGLCYAGRAAWLSATRALQQAYQLAGEHGDHRREAESAALLAWIAAQRGDFAQMLARSRELQASARRHGDIQAQTWGLLGQAEYQLLHGQLGEADTLLAETERLLTVNFNSARAEEIWTYALIGISALMRADLRTACSAAAAGQALMSEVPPAAIYTLGGYAGVAELYLTILEQRCYADGREQRSFMQAAARACRGLQRYALAFVAGAPRALCAAGRYAWLNGNAPRSRALLLRAVDCAEGLAMPYEAARAHELLAHRTLGEQRRYHAASANAIARGLGIIIGGVP
jgi:class 3 adenylate cyclase